VEMEAERLAAASRATPMAGAEIVETTTILATTESEMDKVEMEAERLAAASRATPMAGAEIVETATILATTESEMDKVEMEAERLAAASRNISKAGAEIVETATLLTATKPRKEEVGMEAERLAAASNNTPVTGAKIVETATILMATEFKMVEPTRLTSLDGRAAKKERWPRCHDGRAAKMAELPRWPSAKGPAGGRARVGYETAAVQRWFVGKLQRDAVCGTCNYRAQNMAQEFVKRKRGDASFFDEGGSGACADVLDYG